MDVPARYRDSLSEVEWRRVALEEMEHGARDDVENVLRAFCSARFDSVADREAAFRFVLDYRAAFAGFTGQESLSLAETLAAIEVAELAVANMRLHGEGEAGSATDPCWDGTEASVEEARRIARITCDSSEWPNASVNLAWFESRAHLRRLLAAYDDPSGGTEGVRRAVLDQASVVLRALACRTEYAKSRSTEESPTTDAQGSTPREGRA